MDTAMNAITEGLKAAFIDSSITASMEYKPQLLTNDYENGKKVISVIENELLSCNEFAISVAFITMSGICPLLQTFKELEKRGIPGRILTTDYLAFSEPKALEKLLSFDNISLRLYSSDDAELGFHTKGYLFQHEEIYRIIIGSSNLTLNALTKNKEWNTKLVSSSKGEVAESIISEFENLWKSSFSRDYQDIKEIYTAKYEIRKAQIKLAESESIIPLEQYKLTPNSMQAAFVMNVQELRKVGKSRALLISATGTGKTYASAFFLRESNPKRALFLVHREIIARQAMDSYKRVFGSSKTIGLLSGSSKNVDEHGVDILFATMQTMSKFDNLEKFGKDEFNTIIIDEVHRAGAASYQRIMDYFEPEFWLGMTASPERTDGFDIYGLFDHNIAYEIRLQKALEENMLCSFHYFGITDLEIDGEVMDEETGTRNFRYLVSDERVRHITEQINFYGFSGDRVKGLVFCSRQNEAKELSYKFNALGYRTVALSGEDRESVREDCIERLVSDTRDDYLDYIFTVDIFNEGVDIPEINQVIMLRPTESPIIFVQQLGRGLRKVKKKEYVVILDFIGNYQNNFMIPIALSGDRSYNKDTIRRYMMEGTRIIPGSSTLHFDEISRRRIFQSIDAANFNDLKLIKECYNNLKFKLGHIPALMDFDNYGTIDPLRIFDAGSLGSYYMYLKKYEPEYTARFTEVQELFLEYISKKFASGKRPHELLIIRSLLNGSKTVLRDLANELKENYETVLLRKEVKSLVNVLTANFATGTGAGTYAKCVFIQPSNNDYEASTVFAESLRDKAFYDAVLETVDFGLNRNKTEYSDLYSHSPFKLYAKYTYDDVCRLLFWEKGAVALNIGGYKYDKPTKTYPVFINYIKEENISDTTKYEDRFIDESRLIAISKSGRSVTSEDVQAALHADELGIIMELFVRKNKDDRISKEFYYLGRIHATGETTEFIMPNTSSKAVEISYSLETPVRDDIFDYITA